MKAIRIQIDMLYKVDDDFAEDIAQRDFNFFTQVEKDFYGWADNPEDPREPVMFDMRHHIGEAEEEE